MNPSVIIVGACAGIVLTFVFLKIKKINELKRLTAEKNREIDDANKTMQQEFDAVVDEALERENATTEREDDNLEKRRQQQAKRSHRLNQKLNDIQKNENLINSNFKKINYRKRENQKSLRRVKGLRSALFRTYDEQKSQLVEKLDVEEAEITQTLLSDLEKQVRHERQVWVQHRVEDLEHLNNQVASELVDTLVCRMQLKPTVTPQENKINIPDKEHIKKALAEDSSFITKIQDLTQVELIFNEERSELKVSAYDGVAREICLRLLNRLFQNWQDKEGYIEEAIEHITNRLEREMTRGCGDLLRRLRIENVNIEVVRTQGRLRFRTSYGQNVLDHVLESAYLGGLMASELGLNGKLGRRSSFFHDVGKAIDVTQEGSHPELGGEFLVNIEELPEVAHAAAKHHGPYNPLHLFTAIAKSADAMSGGRPGARREGIDNYVERVQSLESIALRPKGVLNVSITQAGRDIQINVDPKKIDDNQLQEISDKVAADIQQELTYPGEIKVSAVRETWTKHVAH